MSVESICEEIAEKRKLSKERTQQLIGIVKKDVERMQLQDEKAINDIIDTIVQWGLW